MRTALQRDEGYFRVGGYVLYIFRTESADAEELMELIRRTHRNYIDEEKML